MRHLDLQVFESGDLIGTMSQDGKVSVWTVNPEGIPVVSDSRLFGNSTDLTPESEIELMNLTVRTYNILKRERINTVGELLKFIDEKGVDGLLDLRNFGQKCVDEVMVWIRKLRPDQP